MTTSCDARTIADEHGDRYLHVDPEASVISGSANVMEWQTAPDGTKRTPINQAIQHLLIGNKVFPPSSQTSDVTMLNLNFSNIKWTTIVDSLAQHGAFTSSARDPSHFKAKVMRAMACADEGTRLISADDISRMDPFDLRGQQGQAELKFLALIPVATLNAEEGPSMQLICELAGMLGSTSEARRQEADSDIRIMAAILLPALQKYLGFNNPSDAVLATQLKPLLTAAALDGVLRSGETDTITLRNDWVDGIR